MKVLSLYKYLIWVDNKLPDRELILVVTITMDTTKVTVDTTQVTVLNETNYKWLKSTHETLWKLLRAVSDCDASSKWKTTILPLALVIYR